MELPCTPGHMYTSGADPGILKGGIFKKGGGGGGGGSNHLLVAICKKGRVQTPRTIPPPPPDLPLMSTKYTSTLSPLYIYHIIRNLDLNQ